MNLPDPETMVSSGARVQAAIALHQYLNSCASFQGASVSPSRDRDPGDITLPTPRRSGVGFWEVAENRRSRYQCDPAVSLDLSELAAVLRSVDLCPSAGGLRSTYPYLLIPRTHDMSGVRVEAGAYLYQNDPKPLLIATCAVSAHDMKLGIIQTEFVDRFPALMVLVANLDTMFRKYSFKNYQMVFADAGVIIQGVHLACESLGLVGCPIGGLDTSVMHDLLQLSAAEVVTMAFAFGPALGR